MERKFGFLCFRGRIKHNFLRIHFDVLGRHLTLFRTTSIVGLRDEKNIPHHSENIIFFFNYSVNALKLTYFLLMIYIKTYHPFFKLKMHGFFGKNKNVLKQLK